MGLDFAVRSNRGNNRVILPARRAAASPARDGWAAGPRQTSYYRLIEGAINTVNSCSWTWFDCRTSAAFCEPLATYFQVIEWGCAASRFRTSPTPAELGGFERNAAGLVGIENYFSLAGNRQKSTLSMVLLKSSDRVRTSALRNLGTRNLTQWPSHRVSASETAPRPSDGSAPPSAVCPRSRRRSSCR